jgi:DNA-binding NarL/FixJ family response regulator
MRVLVVDDAATVRHRLARLLKEIERVELVGGAADGNSALWLARTLAPDVVLLDLNLPGPSGIEVLWRLKMLAAPPVVIVLTNHATDDYRRACLDKGADFFFDKSKEFEKMLDQLRRLRDDWTKKNLRSKS